MMTDLNSPTWRLCTSSQARGLQKITIEEDRLRLRARDHREVGAPAAASTRSASATAVAPTPKARRSAGVTVCARSGHRDTNQALVVALRFGASRTSAVLLGPAGMRDHQHHDRNEPPRVHERGVLRPVHPGEQRDHGPEERAVAAPARRCAAREIAQEQRSDQQLPVRPDERIDDRDQRPANGLARTTAEHVAPRQLELGPDQRSEPCPSARARPGTPRARRQASGAPHLPRTPSTAGRCTATRAARWTTRSVSNQRKFSAMANAVPWVAASALRASGP